MFLNYLYAKRRFQPDFFLYENNKSAAQAIKEQISKELSVDLMYINSALVSAQNRQRFYAFNWSVEQPIDREILLRDILDSECPTNETSYFLDANSITKLKNNNLHNCLRIGAVENSAKNKAHDSKQYRVYSPNGKATTLCGQGGGLGAKTGLYAIPINTTTDKKAYALKAQYSKSSVKCFLSANHFPQTGVAIPCEYAKNKPIYKVENGNILIEDCDYPIDLSDGYYEIRKLTVTECCRLQTLPDDYCKAVSKSQAYKGLGNGWTAEVIIHILNGALANVDHNEKIVVLSMYDGIGTGRYCLDKMGFKNVEYYAFEIDKFAMQIANDNYPDIIQCGDALQMRDNNFLLGGLLNDL